VRDELGSTGEGRGELWKYENEPSGVINGLEFLDQLSYYKLLKECGAQQDY
jgi:hypothetical protein